MQLEQVVVRPFADGTGFRGAFERGPVPTRKAGKRSRGVQFIKKCFFPSDLGFGFG